MDWLKTCTKYYPKYYDNDDLKVFVIKGKITEVDYQTITGIAYVA